MCCEAYDHHHQSMDKVFLSPTTTADESSGLTLLWRWRGSFSLVLPKLFIVKPTSTRLVASCWPVTTCILNFWYYSKNIAHEYDSIPILPPSEMMRNNSSHIFYPNTIRIQMYRITWCCLEFCDCIRRTDAVNLPANDISHSFSLFLEKGLSIFGSLIISFSV